MAPCFIDGDIPTSAPTAVPGEAPPFRALVGVGQYASLVINFLVRTQAAELIYAPEGKSELGQSRWHAMEMKSWVAI